MGETPVLASRQAHAAEEETLQILVVAKDTQLPVAGARVTVVDSEALAAALAKERCARDTPRGRVIQEQLAITMSTDAAGKAVVSHPRKRLIVEAQREELWGVAYTQAPLPGMVRIEMERDHRLRVVPLSAQGSPVPGVPVSLRTCTATAPLSYLDKTTVSEAESGVAVFEHVQRRFQLGPRTGWHVTWGFPSLPDLRVPVAENSLGGPAILVTVPFHGGLDLTLQSATEAPPNWESVTVALEAFSGMPGERDSTPVWAPGEWTTRTPDGQGRVAVDWLGTGLWVRVTVKVAGATVVVEAFPGPGGTGERVARAIRFGDSESLPRLTGRLRTAEGAPYRGADVQCRLVAADGSVLERPMQVGAEGEFRVLLDVRAQVGVEVELRARVDGLLASCVHKVPRPLVAGDNPLGDLYLRLGEHIASGKVTDTLGMAVEGAALLALQPLGNGEWGAVRVGGTDRTREDGTFVLCLPAERTNHPERWRIAASKRGFAGATVEVGHGAKDVGLVLRAGGSLAGAIEPSAGSAAIDYELTLQGQEGAWGIGVGKDGTFACQDLPEGTYALLVRLRNRLANRELVRVDGLEVVAGRVCRDPRIQRLRLAEGMVCTRVVVSDAETAAPIQGAWVGTDTKDGEASTTDVEGAALWMGTEPPRRLIVRARGYREAEVPAPGNEARVALGRANSVWFVCGPGVVPSRADGTKVGVQLRRRLAGGWSEAAVLGGGRWWLETDMQGIRLAPGEYMAVLVVRVQDGQRVLEEILNDQTVAIQVSGDEGQRVHLPLTREQRQRVEARLLERLRGH
ncbi:MAG: hypothetical protein IT458_20275 [Planctomycetes bacterium]|nr:hypothetical protein [Planctomycetota bacterium]